MKLPWNKEPAKKPLNYQEELARENQQVAEALAAKMLEHKGILPLTPDLDVTPEKRNHSAIKLSCEGLDPDLRDRHFTPNPSGRIPVKNEKTDVHDMVWMLRVEENANSKMRR